jgi:hypothetical protein
MLRGKGGREKERNTSTSTRMHIISFCVMKDEAESMVDLASIALVIARANVPTSLCHQSSPFL